MDDVKKTEKCFHAANGRDLILKGTEQRISEINKPSTTFMASQKFLLRSRQQTLSCIAKGVHGKLNSGLHMFSIMFARWQASIGGENDCLSSSRWRKGANRSGLIPRLLRPAACLLNIPYLAAYAS